MPKTPRQAKAEFILRGETVKAWAERKGYPLSTVRAVLGGYIKGNYGIGHQIAVDLGLKDAPESDRERRAS